jgi:hypothetical protein
MEDKAMLSYTREEVKKMAAQAAEVEIYRFNQADRYILDIHTDNTACMDMKVDDLPDEFNGIVQLMDEEDYDNTLLANSSMSADFEDWYGNKDANVLVVVLSHESAEPLSEYWV